jgi:coenzyme F420-reducing hydrogenase beta subunit
MTITTSLRGVLDNDLCIACGACVFADPSIELQLHPEKQIWEPSHEGGAEAAAVCPAVEVDFRHLQDLLFPGAEQGPYGVVHSVMLAQSTDVGRNLRASSGGMIKEVLIELLSRDDVDGAIVLQHVEGLHFEPGLIRSVDEVDGLPGSIYHNLPKHRVLELLRENDRSLRPGRHPLRARGHLQLHLPRRRRTCESGSTRPIGLLCGWQYSWHSIRAICEFKGIDPDRIVDVSYRGDGPIGKLRIWTDDGREHAVSRRVGFAYQVAFDRTFNTPVPPLHQPQQLPRRHRRRRRLAGEHARDPDRHQPGDQPPRRVTRSSAAWPKSDVSVFTEVTVHEIRESQKPRVAFGNFAYAYAEYLDSIGLHRPVMEGPNRPYAKLVDRDEVAGFHEELQRKLALQRAQRYRFLYWRKATKEFRRYVGRYWDWFSHRVLRAGRERGAGREPDHATLSDFR